jgi:hypothetical protein
VGLLRAPLRWRSWRKVMPLYDGRECPDCGAACIGRQGRQLHRDWHIRRTQWDTQVIDALAEVARRGGLRVGFEAIGEAPEGRYDPEDDDDDEDTFQYVARQEKRLRLPAGSRLP